MNDIRKQGVILKGIGGFYYVLCDGIEYETRARGLFRKDGTKPMPGDRVRITLPTAGSGGYIEEILERDNFLPRPMVANVGMLLIVVAAKAPAADLVLVDKLLVYAACNSIKACLVVNKKDQDASAADKIALEYKNAAQVFKVSSKTGEGMEALKDMLRDKNTCFAGQSAVGKSSILNHICPSLSLETGGLSKKTSRGKHTTRHSELLYIPELNATVTDTPGFSILEPRDMEPEELKNYYPEFSGAECRFGNKCVHYREPGCMIRKLLEDGVISEGRYERYIELFQFLKEKKERKYD